MADIIGKSYKETPAQLHGVLQMARFRLSSSFTASLGDTNRFLIGRLPDGAIPLWVYLEPGPACPAGGFNLGSLGTSASAALFLVTGTIVPGVFSAFPMFPFHAPNTTTPPLGPTKKIVADAVTREQRYEPVIYNLGGSEVTLGHYFDLHVYYTLDAME
jgi:hypothetical protein